MKELFTAATEVGMEDREIVALYASGSEQALSQTEAKYGKYILHIALRILGSEEDARECLNDTLLGAWQAIPAEKPEKLKSYLAAICRKTALNRLDAAKSQKRGSGETALALEELEECIGRPNDADPGDELALRDALNAFLEALPKKQSAIFLQKYWYMMSAAEIARDQGCSESAVKVSLYRTRKKLKEYLKKEGFEE